MDQHVSRAKILLKFKKLGFSAPLRQILTLDMVINVISERNISVLFSDNGKEFSALCFEKFNTFFQ